MTDDACATLTGRLADPHLFDVKRSDLEATWLAAVNQRLREHRAAIPVVDRLVEAAGVDEVTTLDDLVPLLFAHSTYKSYPQALVTRNRWDGMNRWLDTVSSQRVDFDATDVQSADEWMERLHEHGHMVTATSGTSGRHSFLPATRADRAFSLSAIVPSLTWVVGVEPRQNRPIFVFGPMHGPTRASLYYRAMADAYGRPGAIHTLVPEPMRLADLSEMATMRKAIADGTAKPSEIAAFDDRIVARKAQQDARLAEMVDLVLAHRDEPVILAGFFPAYWTMVEAARARGIAPGILHPDSVVLGGGGSKGTAMPDDYEAQILGYFGIAPDRVLGGYGMSELSAAMPLIDGRYRIAPWIVPLVLDASGERVLNADDGLVEGRFAFFDCATEGRWGGVITGDRVTVDFSTPNTCVVPGTITRYSELEGGDDRLTCAGTIDAFVRGAMR